MHRLIFCLMLISFVAQQFFYCCAGSCVLSLDCGHSVQPSGVRMDSNHRCCRHGHGSEFEFDSHDDEHEDIPVDDTHQHHLCVGSHVFYVSVERFEISRFVMCYNVPMSWTNPVELLASSTARPRADNGPPPMALMSRSALGVYRI